MRNPPAYRRFVRTRLLKVRTFKSQLLILAIVSALCALPILVPALAQTARHRNQPASEKSRMGPPRPRENPGTGAAEQGSSVGNLRDSHEPVAPYVGDDGVGLVLLQNQAQSLSLAAADFDEDGVPDLLSGYGDNGRGIISLRRGNVDSIYPNNPEAKERELVGNSTPAPFLSPAHLFGVPTAPDFIGTGDFDADGHWDLVVAARGKSSLSLLSGDGRGNFGQPREIGLPGAVTALVTGEINRPDGLTDVVVAVNGPSGPQALVYEGPSGALQAQPESFPLPGQANSLALGQLSSAYTMDLAVAAGTELLIVYGRDRMLSVAPEQRGSVPHARVANRSFAEIIKSLAIGEFNGSSQSDVALLFDGGAVQVLSRGPIKSRSRRTGTVLADWVKSDVESAWSGGERLLAANFSPLEGNDLLLLDAADRRVRVLHTNPKKKPTVEALLGGSAQYEMPELSVPGSEPVAVLPMQLDVDALTDLVVLRRNETEPVVVMTAQSAHQEAAPVDFAPAPNAPLLIPNGAASAGNTPQTKSGAKPDRANRPERVKTNAKEWQAPHQVLACPTSSISVGQTKNGSLATTDCFLQDGSYVDLYTFNGTAGQQVAINLDSIDFDAYLYLVAPDGSLLATDDDGGIDTNAQIPTDGGFLSLPVNGSYTIYATSFDAQEVGAYSLSLTGPGGGGCPATPIFSGQNVNASLTTSDCIFGPGPRNGAYADVYTFYGYANQQAAVGMVSSSFDTYLYLIGPDGLEVAENDDVNPGVDTNSRIPPTGSLTLQLTGVYTIYATSYFDHRVGGYAIGISLVSPAPFSTVVTNTNDSGAGSLRQAILNANANQGLDTIRFQIGSGARTISPLSALPEITGPVVIDGATQPGFAGAPIIELNGQFTPQGTPGLKISAGNSRVHSLVINRFGVADCNAPFTSNINSGAGIVLDSGGNNIIDGNYIGTDLSGTVALCNSGNGVITYNSSNNTIGGTTAAARNIISGNRFPGIKIGGEFSTGNLIQGNYLGTNVSGTGDLGNRSNGVFVVNGTGHLVGGTVAGARNVISGNDSPGVGIGFSDPSGILVQGNYIGTNAAGTAAIPNLGGGIIVGGFFQLDGSPITATDNTIGGTTPGARNVISGNLRVPGDTNPDGGNGIEIINDGSQRNKVQGNYIGLNANGNGGIPNAGSGVFITRAPNNFIGASDRTQALGTTNYITSNGRYGVGVGIRRANDANPNQFITGADRIDIVYNVIGTDPTQTLRLGNTLDGVYVDADSINIYVNSNVIAFNGRSGVRIPDANGLQNDNDNSGRQVNLDVNYIFANAGIPIDLGFAGVTPNDRGDADGGANLQQNFPALTSFHYGPPLDGDFPSVGEVDHEQPLDPNATITANASFNSTPNSTFAVIWYFSADPQCVVGQPTSRQLDFGKADAPTNANGDAFFSFNINLPPNVTSGIVNATATDSGGSTSEISFCLPISGTATPPPSLRFSAASFSVGESVGSAAVTVTRDGDTAGVATVNYTTSDTAGAANCNVANSGKASSRCDYETAAATLRFDVGENIKTILIPVVDDAYAEGSESFTVTLSSASGASLNTPVAATVTITDNDATTGANPFTQASFFTRQQYLDFLNREPDASGLAFWTNEITSCGTNAQCIEIKRVNVSAAFFLSIEFQQTSYLVERIYKTAYGSASGASTLGGNHQLPVPVIRFGEFAPDTQQMGQGVIVGQTGWEQVLENNKQAFLNAFVLRSRFTAAYPGTMSAALFVDTMNGNAGNPLSASERNQLVSDLTSGAKTRAQVLRAVAEDNDLAVAEKNRAFVLAQYFGYLRRNPNDLPDSDYTGYDYWLGKLNQFNGNFVTAEMVKAFIQSDEYKHRFGP